jgi:hypothetical protein
MNDIQDMSFNELEAWVCNYFTEPEALQAIERAYNLGLEKAKAWHPMNTAPKDEDGNILMKFEDGEIAVVCWDTYYASGGSGAEASGGNAWVVAYVGEPAYLYFGKPTGWMPLPEIAE